MLRPDVVLLVGEDLAICRRHMPGQADAVHEHRGFTAEVRGGCLWVVCAFGSSAMEAICWELTRAGVVERVLLAGTAGSLEGYTGPTMVPVAVVEARSVAQCFDAPPRTWTPSWPLDLPGVASISTDRFYGFSPASDDLFPAEPGLLEAWGRHRKDDAIVEMEVAAFFHFMEQFAPDVRVAAIKVVANPVSDLASLTDTADEAMELAIGAAVRCLQA